VVYNHCSMELLDYLVRLPGPEPPDSNDHTPLEMGGARCNYYFIPWQSCRRSPRGHKAWPGSEELH
jgi:hypothetical protein